MTFRAAVEKLHPYQVAPCIELTGSFKISLLSCDSPKSVFLCGPPRDRILRGGWRQLRTWVVVIAECEGDPVTQRRASTPPGVFPVCPGLSLSISFVQKNRLYS